MKKYSMKSIVGSLAAVALSFFFVTQASAMAPTLSLISNGSYLQATVYGDPNANVILDYYAGGQLLGAGSIGYTSYSGTFTGQLNPNAYAIPNGAQVIVMVNGQQSQAVLWQGNTGYSNGYNNGYNNGYSYGAPVLSQTNAVVTVGQSQTITVSNPLGGYNANQYYISNTANNIATASISGSIVTIYGQTIGSTTLSICSNANNTYGYGNTGGCATLYVTVNGGNYYYNNPVYPTYPVYPVDPVYPYYNNNTPLSVSNSNVQLTVGNTGTVALYGTNNAYGYNNYYNSSYYVTSNGNGVVTATVNGSALTIYGTAPGSTSITVCQTSGGQCATIAVTVIQQSYYYSTPYYTNPYNPSQYYYSSTDRCWYHRR